MIPQNLSMVMWTNYQWHKLQIFKNVKRFDHLNNQILELNPDTCLDDLCLLSEICGSKHAVKHELDCKSIMYFKIICLNEIACSAHPYEEGWMTKWQLYLQKYEWWSLRRWRGRGSGIRPWTLFPQVRSIIKTSAYPELCLWK